MKNVLIVLITLINIGQILATDTLKILAKKTMLYEYHRGSAWGTGLSNFGNPRLGLNPSIDDAINWYMQNIIPELSPYFQTQMEIGEAADFMYNSGKDVRGFAIQEWLRDTDPQNLTDWQDESGNWKFRKSKGEWQEFWNEFQKLQKNTRRIYINRGRDWYYRNINNPQRGVPSDAYWNTWYGRIWNTNDLEPFNVNNPKFFPKKSK